MKIKFLSIQTKLISAFALGAALTFAMPSTAAFAETGEEEKMSIQILAAAPEDDVLTQKQIEIDQYLFEKHVKDIEEKGFKVIHTGVIAGKVEVGITPYSEKNAEYLYGLFGRDLVKIVETEPVELMEEAYTTTAAVDNNAVTTSANDAVTTTAAKDNVVTTAAQEKAADSFSASNAALYAGIAVVALGGTFLVVKRRKTVK